MSEEVVVEVGHREERGKNAARRLRRRGMIPGVVYGGEREPAPVDFDARPVEVILDSEKGLNTLIQLRLAGRDLRRMVMIREVQRHPVTERLLHADFFRIEMDQMVDVQIPVHLIGVPIGVRDEGGMVAHINREVSVRVLPSEIPESLDIDVTELHIGQHVEVGDLELPPRVELLSPPTETVLTVIAKVAEEEAPVAAEAAEEAAEGEAAEEKEEESTEKPEQE
ncbi:MAG: 50S ribosomal protein L25 [Acidobacteriota bacterium]|nr:50S ribosomal protein L25 [Acidobacteriota bacterium]